MECLWVAAVPSPVDSSDTVRQDAPVVTLVFGCVAILAAVAFIIVAYRRRWAWTGFVTGPGRGAPDGQASKSLWDWLQLLIVPLAPRASGVRAQRRAGPPRASTRGQACRT